MRIKKIAPVTPANGLLENTYGTSQTNGYTQEYINNTYGGTNGTIKIGKNIIHSVSLVTKFTTGSYDYNITSLGLNAKPEVVQLTVDSTNNVVLRYDYDNSSATSIKIIAYTIGAIAQADYNIRYGITIFGTTD